MNLLHLDERLTYRPEYDISSHSKPRHDILDTYLDTLHSSRTHELRVRTVQDGKPLPSSV